MVNETHPFGAEYKTQTIRLVEAIQQQTAAINKLVEQNQLLMGVLLEELELSGDQDGAQQYYMDGTPIT